MDEYEYVVVNDDLERAVSERRVDRRRGSGESGATAESSSAGRAAHRAARARDRELHTLINEYMRVFTPVEIAEHAANKYLGVLVAAKYARVLNEFPARASVVAREEAHHALARGAGQGRHRVSRRSASPHLRVTPRAVPIRCGPYSPSA